VTLKCSSTRELFEFYGGEQHLEITMRQFQRLEKGEVPPTVQLIAKIFDKEEPGEKHKLIQAFFWSHLDSKEHKHFLDFLANNLSEGLAEGSFSWEKVEYQYYSEQQLEMFLTNSQAFRLHKRVLLYEQQEVNKTVNPAAMKALIEHDLARVIRKKGRTYLVPGINRYRTPLYKFAPSRVVRKSHEFMFRHVNEFASLEGSDKQVIYYTCQLVTPQIAQLARQQLKVYRDWLQTHVVKETKEEDPSLLPVVFFGFCKELEDNELL